MKHKKNILIKLFFSTLYLSTFTFGGGYVIVTLMKKKFVDDYKWLKDKEMLDLTAIAQSAPGPVAVNSSIVIGFRLAKAPGALTAIVATVLPPFLIISLISVFYNLFRDSFIISQLLDGMQAGVGAVIASVIWDMSASVIKEQSSVSIVIMAVSFIAACIFNINVIYIIIACALFGILSALFHKRMCSK